MIQTHTPAADRTALVVGAGIGGLAAALTLRNAGWRVRVFERAASPRELGFALMLAPNARAALDEIGLGDVVTPEAWPMQRAEIRRPDGRILRRFDLARTPERQRPLVVLRPVLHGALLRAVGDDALTLNAAATGFESTAHGVTLRLENGTTAGGDVLVGADGVGSVIRRLLHPTEAPPRRSGFYAIRGVAQDAARHLGGLTGIVYLGDGIEVGVGRASAGAVYWYVSTLGGNLDSAASPRAAVDRLTRGFDSTFKAIAAATGPEDLRLDELFDREPLKAWGAGRVTLLGDAAHPMLPHAGQGAAQAMEDAVGLGLALRPALDPGGDIEDALRRYERVRSARTRDMVQLGRRIPRTTTTTNRLVQAVRTAVVRYVPASLVLASAKLGGNRDPNAALRVPAAAKI